MWIPNAFWPSVVATAISLFLIIYILRADVRKPANFPSFVLFLSVFLWSLGEMIERVAGPPPLDMRLAYFGALTLFIGIALVPSALIHFGIEYPYKSKMSKLKKKILLFLLYGISAVVIIIDVFNNYLGKIVIKNVHPYMGLGQKIWGLSAGILHTLYSIWVFIAALILLVLLFLQLKNVKMKIVKMQIKITLVGLIIAFVLVSLTGLIPPLLGMDVYPLTTISFSIFGLFIIYTIYRYRMFLVYPSKEEIEEHEKIQKGGFYEMGKDEAYEKFSKLARSGYSCLAFISENPEEFKEKYNLKATPIFQLTEKVGKDRLNPNIEEHREMISFIVSSFIEETKEPVILLDFSSEEISGKLKMQILNDVRDLLSEKNGMYIIV